jgi:hypothetical protein
LKINIGPYLKYWGPYQIADLLEKVGVSSEKCHSIGEWLSETKLDNLCQWIYEKRKRKVYIKIDPHDIWNMDHTLSLIIVPMLYMIKKHNFGIPQVENEDVPEELRDTQEEIDQFCQDGTTSDKYNSRWEYVLNEMIWAMEQVKDEDYSYVGIDEYKIYQARVNNGLRLFGVYFQALWT